MEFVFLTKEGSQIARMYQKKQAENVVYWPTTDDYGFLGIPPLFVDNTTHVVLNVLLVGFKILHPFKSRSSPLIFLFVYCKNFSVTAKACLKTFISEWNSCFVKWENKYKFSLSNFLMPLLDKKSCSSISGQTEGI